MVFLVTHSSIIEVVIVLVVNDLLGKFNFFSMMVWGGFLLL